MEGYTKKIDCARPPGKVCHVCKNEILVNEWYLMKHHLGAAIHEKCKKGYGNDWMGNLTQERGANE